MSRKPFWLTVCERELEKAELFFKRRIHCEFRIDETPNKFPNARDFAYTNGEVVYFSPKIRTASLARIKGLVRHEIAHVLFMQEGTAHSETDADDLAFIVFGTPIYYDKSHIQTVIAGTSPRPAHLPNPYG